MLKSEEKCASASKLLLSHRLFLNTICQKVEKHECLAFPGPAQDVPLLDPAACGGGGGFAGGGYGGDTGGHHHGGGGDQHGAGFSVGGGGDVGGYSAPNSGYASSGSSQAYIVQDIGQGYSLPQQQQPSGHSAVPFSSENYEPASSGAQVGFSSGYVAPTGGGYTGGNGGLVDTFGYDAYDDVGRLVARDTQVSNCYCSF